jgi:penicillin amidase
MRTRTIMGVAGVALGVLVLGVLCAGYLWLRASLPQLDGTRRASALHAAVRITRDSRGVPTIEAESREDLAFATGFVHAQDRYFQMDLARRLAGGELAELFGRVALEQDLKTRLFRFRDVARRVLGAATPVERAVLEAYTRGVNAGLTALGARPWEYGLLGQQPAPWRAEDSVLVVYSMWWDLQANGFRREILRQQIDAALGGPVCADGFKCALGFFYPHGTEWDAPVQPDSEPVARVGIPDAAVLDVRDASTFAPPSVARLPRQKADAGSNSWVLDGTHTRSGAALVANDMHLGQRVPPVWYHARLRQLARGGQPAVDLNGVTLPGTPLLVAGSNGHIAWGFTNSYGNWLSVAALPCEGTADGASVTVPGEPPLAVVSERIRVRGAAEVTLAVRSGERGLMVREERAAHRCWFGRWLAQEPEATNIAQMQLEQATSVGDALALAPAIGIPHQNLVVGDAQGHIAWSIFGRVPEEVGVGRVRPGVPFTTAADHPRIEDPPGGRIWTANARVTGDARAQQLIGGNLAPLGSEYDLGARASQIRDDLAALPPQVSARDMLAVQLDARAVFLARWRELLLAVLDEGALRDQPRRAQFRQLVQAWKAEASTDSVGYYLVRSAREHTQQIVWDMLLRALQISPDADLGPPAQFEGPLWQLLTERPPHLLASSYRDWPQLVRAAVDATIADLEGRCATLARCTWGTHNRVRIRHPLSGALPWLASFLDMPTLELAGDHDMPRVQEEAFGASERFAVSPGHEEEGYLLIPGGQSGHPLSPYYRAGFSEWARGEALPFLPGPAQHTLVLAVD